MGLESGDCMLLTMEQMKHLEVVGNDTYKFVGNENATDNEKEELRYLDESYVDLYGYHMITNHEDLK